MFLEADINFLLKSSLDGLVFLPYAFVVNKWVWDVYSGKIQPHEYNRKWWQYRRKYQGIKEPIHRPDDAMDPAAKYHIAADCSYLR